MSEVAPGPDENLEKVKQQITPFFDVNVTTPNGHKRRPEIDAVARKEKTTACPKLPSPPIFARIRSA